MNSEIAAAVEKLVAGGVVALPTETVYGLAANAIDPGAVKKVFEIKGRPLTDPLILHVLSLDWVGRYSEVGCFGKRATDIARAFWPGPVTIILPKQKNIPDVVTAGLSTVAIRCPQHPVFRKILQLVNFPLAAPSANPFGYISPTTAEQVRNTLGNKVDIIIDGGKCKVGLESTIIDLTQKKPKILRPGAITAAEITKVLQEEIEEYEAQIVSDRPSCPGQLQQHYSPKTKLVIFNQTPSTRWPDIGANEAVIFLKKPSNLQKIAATLSVHKNNIFWLSCDGNPKNIAKNLFDTLQKLDCAGFDRIFCECPNKSGIGIAICDRLTRAAAKFLPTAVVDSPQHSMKSLDYFS